MNGELRQPAFAGQGESVRVELDASQIKRLDAWAAVQFDKPGRPEALRRFLDQSLPPAPREPSATPPFAPDDRVRHAKFGAGTVVAPAVAMSGADPNSLDGTRDAGWRIQVEWDEDERGDFGVADWALTPADE